VSVLLEKGPPIRILVRLGLRSEKMPLQYYYCPGRVESLEVVGSITLFVKEVLGKRHKRTYVSVSETERIRAFPPSYYYASLHCVTLDLVKSMRLIDRSTPSCVHHHHHHRRHGIQILGGLFLSTQGFGSDVTLRHPNNRPGWLVACLLACLTSIDRPANDSNTTIRFFPSSFSFHGGIASHLEVGLLMPYYLSSDGIVYCTVLYGFAATENDRSVFFFCLRSNHRSCSCAYLGFQCHSPLTDRN
jgi:hypothetical protein